LPAIVITQKKPCATTMVYAFDPTDPQYQLHDAFPPDKEILWPYPKDKDGKVLF
jgi:hypothetical protein